ncbi:MAG: TIGR04283 family arsenosugar biosynthesis glycosyltransferase [Thermodesulfobacteriota bacterium]
MKISVIIPILNEEHWVILTLPTLQPLRRRGHEVIVVDGGSKDRSFHLAIPFSEKVLKASRGRSKQMNKGAKSSTGEILLFLHADTFLPEGADSLISDGISRTERGWGYFRVKLSGSHPLLRVVEFLMNLRSRLTRIATGDQAIFIKRELFEEIGGFPEIDLMEDIALCKILKKYGPPLFIHSPVITSSRRWEEKGLIRTILLMWFLRLAFFLNTDPKRLSKIYYPSSVSNLEK